MHVPRRISSRWILPSVLTLLAAPGVAQETTTQEVARLDLVGLDEAVEILVDRWRISHIYAETEQDLFFAQGWNAARDRLFQLELWRRQASGTVSEILAPRELDRDIGTRLFTRLPPRLSTPASHSGRPLYSPTDTPRATRASLSRLGSVWAAVR
jgi:penicillin amidase